MNQQQWLIDEAMPPDAVAIEQMEREIRSNQRGGRESVSHKPSIWLYGCKIL